MKILRLVVERYDLDRPNYLLTNNRVFILVFIGFLLSVSLVVESYFFGGSIYGLLLAIVSWFVAYIVIKLVVNKSKVEFLEDRKVRK